mgnify:FL=1
MLFEDSIIDELTPLTHKEAAQPCDEKAFQWCCRTFTLIIISIFLLSMSIIAASQYSALLTMDDSEKPTILAMGNTCNNVTWNCDLLFTKNSSVYEVSYYDEGNYDYTYLDTTCNSTVSFPYIFIQQTGCCRFVLYNTI